LFSEVKELSQPKDHLDYKNAIQGSEQQPEVMQNAKVVTTRPSLPLKSN